jgi:hypothetical protein
MKLHTLFRGRSKSRLKPIMTDDLRKVQNYQDALKSSDKGSGKTWHYDIQAAAEDAVVWRKNSNSGQWTNYNSWHPPLVRNGSRGNRG